MKNLDKQSAAEASFNRALAGGRVREGDRTGYVRGWNTAGRIIKADRRNAAEKARKAKRAQERATALQDGSA